MMHEDKMDISPPSEGCMDWQMKCESPRSTLHLEVYEESSDDGSSEALEIVTSETELGESSGREHKRKRRDDTIDNEMPELLNNMEEEIERQLDAKAAKSNLTVANVKNILKHVITNEHVLAMVRRTIKDVENDDDDNEEEFPYEPKLTRAKAKELLKTQPDISWPITPGKKPSTSKCQVLIDQELSEDSSDEEYRPNEDDQEPSDEEKENDSVASDVDTQPPTPNPPTPKSLAGNDCGTQTSWTEDGLFKIPQENIGQRTRSKLSLSDTPLEIIEKAFVPPDITTDMYDSECDDEDWRDFLKNFTEPLTTDVNDTFDDDEADPEYNVLADEEEQKVDKEELRVDKAVKVSRKELNMLMAELFDMMSSDEEDVRPSHQASMSQPVENLTLEDMRTAEFKSSSETLPVVNKSSVNDDLVLLSVEQRLLLDQQMRKHVQLTTQHFLQTYGHPKLSHMAGEFKSILVSLQCLAGDNLRSAFNATNLKGAMEVASNWEKKLSPSSSEALEIKSFISKELDMASEIKDRKRQVYRCQFPSQLLKLVSQSEVFLYPLLLPPQPFRCCRFARPLYAPSEDSLIAIGLEEFEAYVQAYPPTDKVSLFPSRSNGFRIGTSTKKTNSSLSKGTSTDALPLITKYLVPTRVPKQLYFHIRKSRLIDNNPIQYYFEHNKAPVTDHYVIPLTLDMIRPPSKQPEELLPDIWRDYLYPKKPKLEGPTLLLLRS